MRTLFGLLLASGEIGWQSFDGQPETVEDGIAINFPFFHQTRPRDALRAVRESLEREKGGWLRCRGGRWYLDLDVLRNVRPGVLPPDEWAHGIHCVEPSIYDEVPFAKEKQETRVEFVLTTKEATMSNADRIFLSHKGVDKPVSYTHLTLPTSDLV